MLRPKNMLQKKKRYINRQKRTRAKIRKGTLPRLSVFRSNRFISAQVIDDSKNKTLAAASSREEKIKKAVKTRSEAAALVGETLAARALKAKVKKVAFERGGYKYHGLVKALADGARKGGLIF